MTAPPATSQDRREWGGGHSRHSKAAQAKRQLAHQQQRRRTARSLRERAELLNLEGWPRWMR